MTATSRKSVPLTPADAAGVATLRIDPSWREVAFEIAGVEMSEEPSEAEALRALVAVGREAIAAKVSEARMQTGYAALAEAKSDQDRRISRAAGSRTAARVD